MPAVSSDTVRRDTDIFSECLVSKSNVQFYIDTVKVDAQSTDSLHNQWRYSKTRKFNIIFVVLTSIYISNIMEKRRDREHKSQKT